MQLVEEREKILAYITEDFKEPPRRFLIGEVQRANDFGIRVIGYSLYIDYMKEVFLKRRNPVSTVLSFVNPKLLFVILPLSVQIDSLVIKYDEDWVLTDGRDFIIKLKDLLPIERAAMLQKPTGSN